MQTMGHFLLTVLCALAVGLLLDRLHLPGGMMIGAVIGACVFGSLSQAAYMPSLANKNPPAKPVVFKRRAKPYITSHASRGVGTV